MNAESGDLLSMSERHGNELTFSSDAITSNRGRKLDIDRDGFGRITEITDPKGNSVSYRYDTAGNLIRVYNRLNDPDDSAAKFVGYTYLTDPEYPHYMGSMTDQLGRTTTTVAYGTDGRLDQIADAFDKAINFDYNTSNLTQTATFLRDDLSVETTTVTYDSWGNVTRAEDAAGQVILHEYLEVDGVKTYLASETRVVGAEGGSDDLVTTYGSTTADYDQFGNPKVATDPAGNKTYYSYNSVGQVTAVTDASGSTTRYGYDFGGYYGPGSGEASDLRYKVDLSGATTMFKYDEHGNVTEVRSGIPFNNFSWYDIYSGGYYGDHYNPYGGPLDPAYRPTTRPEYAKGTLEYAEVGDLVKTTDPDAKWTKSVYDALGNRELSYRWWSDPAHPENPAQLKTLVDRTVYDAEGRATGTKRYEISGHVDYTAGADLDGQTPRFETSADYNDLGRVDQTTDRYANPTETTYDKGGRAIQTRTRTKDLAGNDKWLVTRTEYDEEGRPLYVTDRYVEPTDGTCPPVFGTHTVYDSVGRVVRVERLQNMAIDITGSDLDKRASRSTTYPGSVVSTTQSHFADGRVDYTLDERGARTEYTYDASGQVIESRREVKDENGVPRWLVTRSFYDAASQTAVTMDAFVEGVTTVFTGTRILYDKGYAVASEGRQGVVIDMDRNGPHPKAVLTSLGTLIWSSETFYDDVGRVKKSVGRHAPGVQGPASEYEYGTAGRQTATVGPAVYDPITQKYVRHRSETKYDDQGRVKETWDNIRVELDQSGNPGAPVYTSKHVTASGYDEFGRAVRTTYNDGSYTETGYDSYGRLAWEKDQMGHVTDYTYDTLGRLVEVKLPSVPDPLNSGTPTRPTYTYRYDQFGNHVQTIDPYNHVTETAYDARGRQIARTLPIGTSTPGNPNDFVERKHYSDRSLSEAQAAGESLSLSVALGQLAYEVSFEGMVTAYRYDNSAGGNGRLARTYYYEGPTAEADYLAAVADGQLTQADRLTAYTDDASGRRTKVVQDGDGNLGTESDQRVVSNTYDPHGRLLSVASPEGTLHSEYDAVTGLHTRTWTGTNPASPTTDTWYVYDTLGRLSREVYDSFDGTRDFAADYTLDLAGNRTSKKTDFQPTSEQLASYRTGGALAADETTSYSYDANDRLLTEAKDLAGTTDDRFTVYAYGTGNSGTQQTAKTVCQGLASGGLLKEQAIYVYDVRGRMSQAQVDADGSGGFETTTSYEYDDSGIRVSQTVNGTKTVYLNDANNPTGYAQVLEEKNAAGTVQKSYVLGQDVISQATSASVVHYLLYDGHGSTRALLDAQGSVVVNGATPQVFAYDAYGNPVGFDPATALTGLLYSGERTDPATGLQYLRARYYAPATGRMTTFDPFPGNSDDPISLHRYLYASAAPTAFVDPSGKFSLTCTLASMGIANTLRTLHTEAVSFVFGAVQATVQGMEAGLTPNQIFVQYLLDEVFPIVGLLYSVGKWALEVMEAGIFLEARDSDLAADMYSVSEEAAVDWIHSGGPLEEEDPASASGPGGTPASLSAASFSASAAGSALGGATGALRSVRRNGRLVTAGLKNILRSGLRKIPVMSYGELRAHNLKEGLSDLIQKNHLNQDRAFRELGIPRNQGLCINLKGHATVPGTSHNKFHTAMDNHWDLVRANKRPATAGAYNEAMHKALLNAGYDGETADAITQLAMKQQAGYNIKPSTVFPYIPESFT